MRTGDKVSSEFCRPVAINDLKVGAHTFNIEAGPKERAALAQRFGLISLERLCAEGKLASERDSLIRLRARLKADVAQLCVVSLEPVISRIDVAFERLYSLKINDTRDILHKVEAEVFLSAEADEMPDPIVNGSIDVGEAVAEQLALELDPFPKAPGAVLESDCAFFEDVSEQDPKVGNPFAGLIALRKKLNPEA